MCVRVGQHARVSVCVGHRGVRACVRACCVCVCAYACVRAPVCGERDLAASMAGIPLSAPVSDGERTHF